MRGHNHQHHRHTTADLMWAAAQKLLPEMFDMTTPEGLRDADECLESKMAQANAPRVNVLCAELHGLLEEVRDYNLEMQKKKAQHEPR
jgi:hypothetical protein